MTSRSLWIRLAALSGLASVLAGAFAAHGISDPMARDWMRTGSTYEAIHALGALLCLVLAAEPRGAARWIAPVFLAGSVLFSGTLYAMALGAPHWLGAVTPLGGLMFMAGWVMLAWTAGGAQAGR